MPVVAGSRLGPYEIIAPLGAGGMGEVWRARDPRLGRDVAVKIVGSSEPDRLRRFEQEARAVAALNHPNICAIYDVGLDYIAMEFIDGAPLRPDPNRSIRSLIDIAVQAADGLAAAHAAGFIHRDLKPDNIMLTRDGRVKILDFGLAKPLTRGAVPSENTQTITTTDPGTVLGTVAYMSPEQARGGVDIDARSDQFSLGLILYELLSGKRAFARDSGAETMAAIIRDEPEPLPASVPAPLRWTVERCMAKDPAHRYDTTRDLYLELKQLRERISEAVTPSGRAMPVREPRGRGAWVAAAIVCAALLVGAGYAVRARLAREPAMPQYRRVTWTPGDFASGAFIADGRSVILARGQADAPAKYRLTDLTTGEMREVAVPENSGPVAVSSTGELAYCRGGWNGQEGAVLVRQPLSGGGPREVADHVVDADWAPDGDHFAAIRVEGHKRHVEYPIGKIIYETEDYLYTIQVSPGGDRIAVLSMRDLLFLDRSGHVARYPLNPNGMIVPVRWSPDGSEIWITALDQKDTGALTAIAPDGKQRTLLRAPERLYLLDVARDGRLLISTGSLRYQLTLAQGGVHRDLTWRGLSTQPLLTRDGRNVVFTEVGTAGGVSAVYMRTSRGGPAVRLADGTGAMISPDGRWVAASRPGRNPELYIVPTGAGEETAVAPPGVKALAVAGWLADGSLVISAQAQNASPRCYVWSAAQSTLRALTPGLCERAAISLDGRRMVFRDGGEWHWVETAGGPLHQAAGLVLQDWPIAWSDDNRSVFTAADPGYDGKIWRVDIDAGTRQLWYTGSLPGWTVSSRPAITPDGKQFAFAWAQSMFDVYIAEGLTAPGGAVSAR